MAESGLFGAVDGRVGVRNWSVSEDSQLQSFASSATKGAKGRDKGNIDWRGRYAAYGPVPSVMPGDNFTFTGVIGQTPTSKGVQGPAIVEAVNIDINVEQGGIINHVVEFAATGPIVRGNYSAADASIAEPYSSIGTKVQIALPAAEHSWSELTKVRSVNLRITSENNAFVDTSTDGHVSRKKGNINVELSIAVNMDDADSLPGVNLVRGYRLFIDATTFWEILWMMHGALSDFVVDREEARIVGCSLNSGLRVSEKIGSNWTSGSIKKPDGSTWWPFA